MLAPAKSADANLENLVLSSTEEKALILLGQGVEPSAVAFAVGVSESRISQLISDPHFAARVAELRYNTLAKHAVRDNAYDELEDSLLERLKNCLPMMYKPMEVLASIRVINAAKRRGSGVTPSQQNQAPVVNLMMPIQIINQYRLNAQNQVIKAGQQDLITVQSGSMRTLLAQRKAATPEIGNQNVINNSPSPEVVGTNGNSS
jgi:hypothetical protein